jgi:transposase
MSKKRIYQSVDVNEIEATVLVVLLAAVSVVTGNDAMGCIIAIDVAKHKFFAGVANVSGELVRIIRFQHPTQTLIFLRLLQELKAAGVQPQVVMEPTGAYGDSIRGRCMDLELPVYMVSPKHTHDMAEVLDGVPSHHDAKATALIAKLHAMGRSHRYVPPTESRRQMRAIVARLMMYQNQLEPLYGQLEALLAKYWPEFGLLVEVREQRSGMALLEQFPGPKAVAEAESKALELLGRASHGALAMQKRREIIACASTSLGESMNTQERTLLSELAAEIRRLTGQCDRVEDELDVLVKQDPAAKRMAEVVGKALAAAILSYVGDPNGYKSTAAFEKACGLNLKIRSSGEHVGKLKITKRGPSEVRQLLYLAVLRLIQKDSVTRQWYEKREAYQGKLKKKAVIAVMRKLIKALWHVGRGAEFDSTKLFDTRRLQAENDASSASPAGTASSSNAGVRNKARKQHRPLSVPEVQAP